MSIEWPSTSPGEKQEKTFKEKQWEMSRTGWNLENERRDGNIFELKEPFGKILRNLSEDINLGKIKFLIGDDASGRVPTLLLKKCIAGLYEEKNLQSPKTFFINGIGGGRELDDEKFEQRVNEIYDHLDKCLFDRDSEGKIVIVTDTINSGQSIMPLVQACGRFGMMVEVVTVGYDRPKEEIEKDLGVKVYVGMEGTPQVYGKPAFSGVYKEKPEGFDVPRNNTIPPLISEPYKERVSKEHQQHNQLWLNEIRREINVLSEELIENYKLANFHKKEK